MPDGMESDDPVVGCFTTLLGIPIIISGLSTVVLGASTLFYDSSTPTNYPVEVNRKSEECWRIDLNNDGFKDLIIESNGKYDTYYGQKDGSFRPYDVN